MTVTTFEGLSWTALPSSGDGVLASIDLGADQLISGVELIDANLSGAALAGAIAADTGDGVTWAQIGEPILLGGEIQTRRIMAAPGAAVTARHVRIRQAVPAESGTRTLAIAALKVLTEGEQAGARIRPFTYDDDASYVLVFSAENGEVYKGGERKAAFRMTVQEGSLARLDFTQRLDTMLVFHEEYEPWRIYRLGTDEDWDARPQVFDSMFKLQFPGETYTNGVNEVQQLEFTNFSGGETFNITLDGQTTSSIAYSATAATLAASIKSALEALPELSGGTVTVTNTGGSKFSVTFSGEAGQMDWPEMAPSVISSASGVVTAATLTEGEEGGEDAISAARGWPRCGTFADGRLILSGLRDLPQTGIVSRLGEYFEFESVNGRPTDAFEFTIDTADANGIRRIFNGETVQIFTASGVHFLSGASLVADEPTERRKSGSLGIQLNLPPLELDGGTVYVQKGGRGVRELQYNDNTKRYVPLSLSVRAPSVIQTPVDFFVRKTGTNFEDELLSVCNSDGGIGTLTSLREQDVAAWANERTDGRIIAGGADSLARTYLAIQREIGEDTVTFIEMEDPDRMLDCSVLRELEDSDVVDGLEHLEGREIYVVGLDRWWGPLTVSGGEVQLDEAITATVEAGLWFDAWVTSMEPRFQKQDGSLLDVKKRVVDVTVSLLDSIMPGVRYRCGTKTRAYAFPDPRPEARSLDRMPLEAPYFTGQTRLEGFTGWDRSVDVTIFRRVPGPLHIRTLKMGVQV